MIQMSGRKVLDLTTPAAKLALLIAELYHTDPNLQSVLAATDACEAALSKAHQEGRDLASLEAKTQFLDAKEGSDERT